MWENNFSEQNNFNIIKITLQSFNDILNKFPQRDKNMKSYLKEEKKIIKKNDIFKGKNITKL